MLNLHQNKPAVQASGADPSRRNSTTRKNPPIQQSQRNFWTNEAILMPFTILNIWQNANLVCFMTGSTIFNHLGVTAP